MTGPENEFVMALDAAYEGDALGDASSALLRIAHQVAQGGKPGSVTVRLTVRPWKTKRSWARDRVIVEAAVVAKEPREPAYVQEADLFLAEGALSVTDPRQPGLPLEGAE